MHESHYSCKPVVLGLENNWQVVVQQINPYLSKKPLAVGIKLMAKGFLSFLFIWFEFVLEHFDQSVAKCLWWDFCPCLRSVNKTPFTKDADVSTLFTSNDFNQMTNRLEFIIRSRGIGVFLSNPGMVKTTCLRKTLESLNPNRYVVIYICIQLLIFTACLIMSSVLKRQPS